MPWKQMDTLTQREDCIQDWLRRGFPMRGLCAHDGIAPKTGYKWLNRFQAQGMSGDFLPSFPCKRESIRASIRLLVSQTPTLPCEDGFPLSRE